MLAPEPRVSEDAGSSTGVSAAARASAAAASAAASGRTGLLELVDAAASTLVSLERSVASRRGEVLKAEALSGAELLKEILRASLSVLHGTRGPGQGVSATMALMPATSSAAHEGEKRRLAAWDDRLESWLPEDWPGLFRPSLLGSAVRERSTRPEARPSSSSSGSTASRRNPGRRTGRSSNSYESQSREGNDELPG
ncbi:unnamed protein product [Polarella glacialis]|uniref:Uncharacterized protein n=1 Tax=Polarella glacialis TaxID=89957 RepID=A0A813GNJ5_POLGL|nr:unnamed protein product [Polarella glacialis]